MVHHLRYTHATRSIISEHLTNPVKNHHRLIHRVAENRQHRREYRERKLPLKEREKAEDDNHIMQIRQNPRDRKFPLEAERQINHNAHTDE